MSFTPFVAPAIEVLADLLPAYEFQAFIAQGGMGAVYKARQRSLDRDVAIKILPRELSEDPDFRKSFETEARAMARLNHPNLVGVYDSGAVDGMLYIAMEYVNGKSLYYSAYNMAVDPTQAATIIMGICDGLAHAHENGVIHRDIKPANILLTPKREPKIGDFGLARPSGSEGPGLIMGTPGYTAPEIIDDPDHSDRRSDIYAVGVILYELLTGRKQEPNCPPPSMVGGCDPLLDAIWKNATQPNPESRYPDASLMAKALDDWLKKLGTSSPEGPAKPAVAPRVVIVRRNRGPARNLAIIAVMLVTIAFAWKIYQRTEADRVAIEADATRRAQARLALTKPTPQPSPVTPQPKPITPITPITPEPAPIVPELPKPETAMKALERLRSALANGKRDEMPPGTVRRGESDFLFVPTAMTWQEASSFADTHGGHLALPLAEEDITWLSNLVPADPVKGNQDAAAWIGAGRSGRSAWTLVDGSPWKLKAPTGTGLYLALDDLGLIRARKAEDRYPFFIQWQRDGSNPGELGTVLKRVRDSLNLPAPLFPPGTVAYEARHVLVVSREVNATRAAAFAEAAGGTLMVPASREEAGWLAEQIAPLSAYKGLWLGGERKDAEWRWVTGEAWSFATWNEGYPTKRGDGLVVVPGKGWRNADTSETASGFIIEWSKDRDSASAAPPTNRKPLVLGELAAKSKQLVAALDQERQRDLATNAGNFATGMDAWLRRQNRNEIARWSADVSKAKELVVNNRVPSKITPDSGIRLTAEMAKICSDCLLKQQSIDSTFKLKATKIRDAYLARLKEARDDATTRGQKELAESIDDEMDAAADLVD